MEEKQEYIRKVFDLARTAGMCRTQKEFAKLLGIDPTGLSLAMNGHARALTDSLVGKIRAFSVEHGLETGKPAPKPGGVYLPPETLNLFTNLSETIRLQAELLTRNAAPATPATPTQKNDILDVFGSK